MRNNYGPVYLSSGTLFFPTRPVRSQQVAVVIYTQKTRPQREVQFMLEVYCGLRDIADFISAHVALLWNFTESNVDPSRL